MGNPMDPGSISRPAWLAYRPTSDFVSYESKQLFNQGKKGERLKGASLSQALESEVDMMFSLIASESMPELPLRSPAYSFAMRFGPKRSTLMPVAIRGRRDTKNPFTSFKITKSNQN